MPETHESLGSERLNASSESIDASDLVIPQLTSTLDALCHGRSLRKAALFAQLRPAIERAMVHGRTRQEIVDALARSGVEFTPGLLSNYLSRARRRDEKQALDAPHRSARGNSPRTAADASIAADPTPPAPGPWPRQLEAEDEALPQEPVAASASKPHAIAAPPVAAALRDVFKSRPSLDDLAAEGRRFAKTLGRPKPPD